MCCKIKTDGVLSGFKESVIQKKWVAIALLVTSLVVFGGATTLGGLGLFAPPLLPSWLVHGLGTIGQRGLLSTFISGSMLTITGTLLSIALLANKGRSPLHRALEKKENVDHLLTTTSIHKTDHFGNTPLHYAAESDHAFDTLLAQQGINVNAKNNRGETPLHKAILSGKKESVQKLLTHSAVIDAATLEWAIDYGSEEIVGLLLEHAKLDTWKGPLLTAIQKGKKNYIASLLSKYSDQTHQDLHEALFEAVRYYKSNSTLYKEIIFSFLLPKGVNVNARDPLKRTALHIAANANNADLTFNLLKIQELDVNLEDSFGRTPLGLAMQWPWIEVAIEIVNSKKVSKANLEKAKEIAEKTGEGEYRTDCSRVILAINKALESSIST